MEYFAPVNMDEFIATKCQVLKDILGKLIPSPYEVKYSHIFRFHIDVIQGAVSNK